MTRRPLQSHANTRADWSLMTGVVIPGQPPKKCPQFTHCICASTLASLVLRGHHAAQQTYGRKMRRDETQEQVRTLFTSPFPLRKCSSVSCKSRRAGVKFNHDFSDSSHRRPLACCIRPATEGGRTLNWTDSWDLRHTHSCLAVAVFACTQETLSNLVTLV